MFLVLGTLTLPGDCFPSGRGSQYILLEVVCVCPRVFVVCVFVFFVWEGRLCGTRFVLFFFY